VAVSVLIADDHAIIREGIKSVLASHPEYRVCAEATDGQECLDLVQRHKPDIALLDISMPAVSGLDLIQRLKVVSPGTKVIMITVHKMGAYVLKALRAGASGYLNKEDVVEELLRALARVRDGGRFFGASVSEYLADILNESPKKTELKHLSILTEREQDVLRLVAEGKTAKEIAWTLCLSRRTVENHKNSVLKKLNLHKTSELIRFAAEKHLLDTA
jgi:DNA-binding NarL/FixJ family response regulator